MSEGMNDGTMNTQVIDAATTTAALLTGQAPSQATGILDTVMAETLGMSMHNAVMRQQADGMVGAAAVTATCAKMLQAPPYLSPKKDLPPMPDPSPTIDQLIAPLPPPPAPPAPSPPPQDAYDQFMQGITEAESALLLLKKQAAQVAAELAKLAADANGGPPSPPPAPPAPPAAPRQKP